MEIVKQNDELVNKIVFGLKLAIQKLYEEKAANNEKVVISVNGKAKYVSARKILKDRAKK